MKHLINNIGDSSTACGEDIDEIISKGDSITISAKFVDCENCLNNYNYWKKKIINILNKSE